MFKENINTILLIYTLSREKLTVFYFRNIRYNSISAYDRNEILTVTMIWLLIPICINNISKSYDTILYN